MLWSVALSFLTLIHVAHWPTLERSAVLPHSHTITGLARDADGTWWAGNDGRMFEGDKFRPGVIHLSAGFKPLAEFKLPGQQSLQGVALVGNEVWAAYYPTSSLERFAKDGRHIGSVKLRDHPNGLAFDGRNVIVSMDGERVAHWYTRDGQPEARTEKLLRDPDHLAWVGGHLWYSTGDNGKPGCVLASAFRVYCFHEATAVEGFAFLPGGRIAVASDGYFHGQKPKQNRILIYRL